MWIGSGIQYGGAEFYLAVILLGVFGLVGTVVNALVIAAIWRSPMMKRRSNVLFIVSLAMSDIYLGLVTIPVVLTTLCSHGWVLGGAMCKITAMLDNAMIMISLWSVACSALDRCVAVAKPLFYRRQAKKRRTLVVVLVVWAIGLVTSGLPLLGFNEYIYEPGDMWCALNITDTSPHFHGYAMIYGLVYLPVPLVVAVSSYIGIFWVARNLKKREILRSKALFYIAPSTSAVSQTPSIRNLSTESGIESDVEPQKEYLRYSSNTTNTTNLNSTTEDEGTEKGCECDGRKVSDPRVSVSSHTAAVKYAFDDPEELEDSALWPAEYDRPLSRLSAISTGTFSNFFADTLTRSFLSTNCLADQIFLQDLALDSYEDLFEIPLPIPEPRSEKKKKKSPRSRRVSFNQTNGCVTAPILRSKKSSDLPGLTENDDSKELSETSITNSKDESIRDRSESYSRKTRKRSSALQIKAGVLSIAVILSVVALHLPAFLTAFLTLVGTVTRDTPIVFWLVLLNPAFNPFIYGLLNAEIRRHVYDIIRFKSAKNQRRRASTIKSATRSRLNTSAAAKRAPPKISFVARCKNLLVRMYETFKISVVPSPRRVAIPVVTKRSPKKTAKKNTEKNAEKNAEKNSDRSSERTSEMTSERTISTTLGRSDSVMSRSSVRHDQIVMKYFETNL